MSNIRTIPAKTSYLHPTQRNLSSSQIGTSSHKNQYNVGVLQGSFVEDRAAYEQPPPPAQLDLSARMSRTAPDVDYAALKREHMMSAAAASHSKRQGLIFGTAQNGVGLVTMNELMYRDHLKVGDSLRTDQAVKASATSGRKGFVEKKRDSWKDETDPARRYDTTYVNRYEPTAKTGGEERKKAFQRGPPNKWGGMVKELSQSHSAHQGVLRDPIELTHTPLDRVTTNFA